MWYCCVRYLPRDIWSVNFTYWRLAGMTVAGASLVACACTPGRKVNEAIRAPALVGSVSVQLTV
jgi:hypothetical protein